MDHRLEKLKRARESARERQTRFSILALLLSSLQGFVEFQVTLDQLDESVEEVSEILHALLEELDNQPLASPMLILNLEKSIVNAIQDLLKLVLKCVDPPELVKLGF